LAPEALARGSHFDLTIVGGRVVDGSGAPWYHADVGIQEGRITAIGRLGAVASARTIDVRGLTVAPGFIDVLHNADMAVLTTPTVEMAVTQGITTGLGGCCGLSMAPVSAATREEVRHHAFFKTGYHELPWDWLSFADYLQATDGASAINYASLIGFDNLWFAVKGFDATAPSDPELDAMSELAGRSMSEGAVGMSHGAGAASLWSTHEQVTRVARAVAEAGGIYACHQRTITSDDPLAAFKEGIAVAQEAGLPIHFVHFKSTSVQTHGHEREMLDLVDEARRGGTEVTLSSYPYGAGGGGLRVPAWAEEGGPTETLRRLRDLEIRDRIAHEIDTTWPYRFHIAYVHSDKNSWMEGKTLDEIAARLGTTVGHVVCDLLLEENLAVQQVHRHGGDEGLATVMQHPAHMACTDAIYTDGMPHPRCFGAFPRWLGKYVRELGVIRLEECVRQMTSAPAMRLGLGDRGLIKLGMAADVTVFNADTIADRATYDDPSRRAVGIEHVLVNGTSVLEHGRLTGATPGKALKRG
jgi:N-acyl-D-amino-acid deacylase